MMRRWIIRGLALALLTLCVVAWVGSYCRPLYIEQNVGGRSKSFFWAEGRVGYFFNSGLMGPWPGWKSLFDRGLIGFDSSFWFTWDSQGSWHILGFCSGGTKDRWWCTIPLWFPAVVVALVPMLWLVWRKTRSKYNGRGFPVEPARKEATKP